MAKEQQKRRFQNVKESAGIHLLVPAEFRNAVVDFARANGTSLKALVVQGLEAQTQIRLTQTGEVIRPN